MYLILKNLHSSWAYLVLLVLILCIFNAITGKINGKDFESIDLRLFLFGLIFSHIQFLIALILYFVSPWFEQWSNLGMGGVMKDAQARLFLVEHPFTNILAITLITIGWSVHKHQSDPAKKFLRIALFYGLGLFMLLSRIPWGNWLA
mgnify:CR=1 FL=1